MKTVSIDPNILAFVELHDAGIALAVIFAFAGLFAFGPKVTK